MQKYANKFDEAIDNCPYSTEWYEYRNNILSIVLNGFYDDCSSILFCQTKIDDDKDRIRIIFFELYGNLYVWSESIVNGLIESGQLDKVYQYDKDIAFVMYSNLANVPAFAPLAIRMLNNKELYPIHELSHLNKAPQ